LKLSPSPWALEIMYTSNRTFEVLKFALLVLLSGSGLGLLRFQSHL